eukprot:CAMPEP_0197617720 /NCGR_PEP_ID=MMETSP1326-20131121/61177_1 /TAXON_ID=1155430 /ORGANISM="Genus nov. species nov., Strain RCC2288" /LENGTH=266 /DNA_ID=CAMNT_0043186615 /DNA_START=330 /DNA_END=1128 /DNA_ORIENTATION=+
MGVGAKEGARAEGAVHRVRHVRHQVGHRAHAGGLRLHHAAEEGAHGQAAVLQLLDLELLEVVLLGELEGVEAQNLSHVVKFFEVCFDFVKFIAFLPMFIEVLQGSASTSTVHTTGTAPPPFQQNNRALQSSNRYHQSILPTRMFSGCLVEAEAGGGVGEHVGVHGVRDVCLPVSDGAFLGGQGLEDAPEPREHGQAAVLQLLDLELLEVAGLGEAQRVEAPAGSHGQLQLGERVLEEPGAVALGGADEKDLDGEDGPEVGVAGALG